MIIIDRQEIARQSPNRPQGYEQDVLSYAVEVDIERIGFTDEDWKALKAKYRTNDEQLAIATDIQQTGVIQLLTSEIMRMADRYSPGWIEAIMSASKEQGVMRVLTPEAWSDIQARWPGTGCAGCGK